MTILVTGSTGTNGVQVLSYLQGRGIEVRALTRSPDTAKLPSGVAPVRGDLADVDSVRAALDGVSTLFLLIPNVAGKYTVERMIEALDLPATMLRPAYFIQNDVRLKDSLLKFGVYGMPIGGKRVSMVDTRDIGEAAANELVRRELSATPLPRETYTLAGPDALTGEGIASIWSEVLGRAIRYGGDDLVTMEQRLKSAMPAWHALDETCRPAFGPD
jgi:uncharacterized protein YbjT (DUF2867 family)